MTVHIQFKPSGISQGKKGCPRGWSALLRKRTRFKCKENTELCMWAVLYIFDKVCLNANTIINLKEANSMTAFQYSKLIARVEKPQDCISWREGDLEWNTLHLWAIEPRWGELLVTSLRGWRFTFPHWRALSSPSAHQQTAGWLATCICTSGRGKNYNTTH